ncbi:hypothetical protein, partial [Salmonella sp. gx-f7]|uniref:hypothetical protein n=1 Tax=Salmonella sp. gx-f7 TaxID=2582606 RepID=UPI001F235A61
GAHVRIKNKSIFLSIKQYDNLTANVGGTPAAFPLPRVTRLWAVFQATVGTMNISPTALSAGWK